METKCFQVVGDGEEERDGRAFLPFAQAGRGSDGDQYQRVHVRTKLAQRLHRFGEPIPEAGQDRDGQQDADPVVGAGLRRHECPPEARRLGRLPDGHREKNSAANGGRQQAWRVVRTVETGRAIGVVFQAGDAMLVALRAGVDFGVVVGGVVDGGGPLAIVIACLVTGTIVSAAQN